METGAIRAEIDGHIAAGDTQQASRALARLWDADPGPAIAPFVVSRFEKLKDRLALTPYRLAILRSFTVEPLIPLLRAGAFAGGIDLSVHTGEFNVYAQEIFAPESALYRFQPQAVVLAIETREIVPGLWQDFSGGEMEDHDGVIARAAGQLRERIAAFRRNSEASLIVHNFERPAVPAQGILDGQNGGGQSEAIQKLNAELSAMAREYAGVYVLDYDGLVARHGRDRWHDAKKWLTVRLPMAAAHLNDMAREWLRFVHPLSGRIAKALVVDLDNTPMGRRNRRRRDGGNPVERGASGCLFSGRAAGDAGSVSSRSSAGDRQQKQSGRRDGGAGAASGNAAAAETFRGDEDRLGEQGDGDGGDRGRVEHRQSTRWLSSTTIRWNGSTYARRLLW